MTMNVKRIRFIQTADWHIGDHKYSIDGSRLRQIKNNINIIVDYAIKNELWGIIVCGDVFDMPNPPETFQAILATAIARGIKAGIKFRFVAGDHDTNGITYSFASKRRLLDNDYVRFIFPTKTQKFFYEDIGKNFRFVYVPYQHNMPRVIECCSEKRLADSHNLLFTHAGISDATLPNGIKLRDCDLSINDLQGWSYVGLGHFHNAQKLLMANAAYYSGSIIKIDWSERTNIKSFNVVDIDYATHVEFVNLPDVNMIEACFEYSGIKAWLEKQNKTGVATFEGRKIEGSIVKIKVSEVHGDGALVQLLINWFKQHNPAILQPTISRIKSLAVNVAPVQVAGDLNILSLWKVFCKTEGAKKSLRRRGFNFLQEIVKR